MLPVPTVYLPFFFVISVLLGTDTLRVWAYNAIYGPSSERVEELNLMVSRRFNMKRLINGNYHYGNYDYHNTVY